jgi:nitrogen fixation NifU-like protein
MYSDRLLDHFQNPRNAGELPPPAIVVDVVNPVCGDMLRLSALVENGRIVRAAFKTRGCTASIAASSALTELIAGRTVKELPDVSSKNVEEAVGGLPVESRHAAALCIDAVRRLQAAIMQAG